MSRNNMGIAPMLIAFIASVIIDGIKIGYSYYQASKIASEQAKLERALTDAEVTEIAYALSQQTTIGFSQWYNVIKLTFVPTIPGPNPQPEPKKDYTMYIVFGLLGVLILTRR